MKKVLFSLVFIFIGFVNADAQWTYLTAPIAAEHRCMYFTSNNNGYMVGASGPTGPYAVIHKTDDSGSNWNDIPTIIYDSIRAVAFPSDSTGYVVGNNGSIYKSYTAGLGWVAQTSGVTSLLRSLSFTDTATGYVCGGDGTILKTTDGGATWNQQTSGTMQDLINIRFINADTGYCVSSPSTLLNGLILRTTDGGNNWTTVHTDTFGLLTLSAIDSVVYAGGAYQTILKSTDFGINWSIVHSAPPTVSTFRGSCFISVDKGYMVGDSGRIFYTANGGANWVNQAYNYNRLYSVFCPSPDTCYACGYNATILRYIKPCVPDPAVAIFGNTTVCANDTQTYYVNAVAGTTYYLWQLPAGATVLSGQGDTLVTIMFGTASGNIAVVDSNQCGKSTPKNLFINTNAAPPVPVITLNGNALNSSSATNYQWYLNGVTITGATSQTYIPTLNGTYTVIVTNANGCTSVSVPFILTNVGIDEKQSQYQLTIQPNPANENVSIGFNEKSSAVVSIEIFDIVGKKIDDVIHNNKLKGAQKININCKDWSPGTYFIKMLIADDVFFEKLVKE
ncbi:MAG: YCF48-related protein [Bacteroidia bacterium]